MPVSKAQLRTLQLLQQQPAFRVYWSGRPGEYTWEHEQAEVSITATLHRLFVSGHAQLQPGNKDVAILTGKGRSVLKERGDGPERFSCSPSGVIKQVIGRRQQGGWHFPC